MNTCPCLIFHENSINCNPSKQNFGSNLHQFGQDIDRCLGKAWRSIELAFDGLSKITVKASPLGDGLNVVLNTFNAVQLGLGESRHFADVTKRIIHTQNLIDVAQIFDSIAFFARGDHKTSSKYDTLGTICMLSAGVGGLVLLIEELAFFSFSKISESFASLAKTDVLKGISQGIGSALTVISGMGYAFFGASAISRIINAKDSFSKNEAWIQLAGSIAQIATRSFSLTASMMNGTVAAVGLLALGTLAAGLSVTSYLYSELAKPNSNNNIPISN